MFVHQTLIKLVAIAASISIIIACSDSLEVQQNGLNEGEHLTVYKKTNCKCCDKWIHHIRDNGFNTISHSQSNLSAIKEKYNIQPKSRACHTSVTRDGFVFEGHIPAKFIKTFLVEKPVGAKGLSVPAMPMGTPGMEFDDRFQPYKIYLLKADNAIEIYAEVNSAKEQI